MFVRSRLTTVLIGALVLGLALASVFVRPGTNVTLAQPQATLFGFSPHVVCGRASESDPDSATLRPGIYATQINVFNYNPAPATVQAQVILLAYDDEVQGREPKTGSSAAQTTITLPANSATIIDCPRLIKLLDPVTENTEDLTIAFVNMVSSADLNVEVIHTVEGRNGNVSIQSEMVPSKPVSSLPPPVTTTATVGTTITATTGITGTATTGTTITATTGITGTATTGTATRIATATTGTATRTATATTGTTTPSTTRTPTITTTRTVTATGTITATLR